ncbi:MAG: DUF3313 domain-containing protein [Gammaproteobacteria bacterium]
MKNIFILILVILIAGCANKPSKPDFEEESSGFLVHYDLLEPVPGAAGMDIYAYKDDEVDADDYHAAIVEPVFIYEGATHNDTAIHEQIETARQGINTGLRKAVAQHYQLTQKPGPGVFRMQIAITGADLEDEGLKPWNIIPVSAAITVATHATGFEKKKPVLMVEMKITDSQTNEVIKEIVTISSGEYFRNEANTSEEFANLAHDWIAFVVDYSDMFTVED